MASPRFPWERSIREDPDVTGNLLLVLLTFATFANRQGIAYPGADALASATGLGNSTVRAHLKAGVRLGYLSRESRGGRRGDNSTVAARYRLSQPPAGQRLSEVSTASGTILNRQMEGSQPPAGQRVSLQEQIKGSSAPAADDTEDLDAILARVGREAS